MALNSYSALKTAVADWMARSDISSNVADWITLAESTLNAKLGPVEVSQSLTGTSDSRNLDTSSYSIVEPLALFLTDPSSSDESELVRKNAFARISTSGRPSFWEMTQAQDHIELDRPCDQAYSFRLRYRQRFALSDSVTSNWLLANYPNLYLSATIFWGGGYTMNYEKAATFKAVLEDDIRDVKNIIARNRRSTLTVDPALYAVARAGTYQGVE